MKFKIHQKVRILKTYTGKIVRIVSLPDKISSCYRTTSPILSDFNWAFYENGLEEVLVECPDYLRNS